MNIDRKRFPIIQQVQNGKLDLPMKAQEIGVYFPFISIANSIVSSKPRVDYLCNAQIEKVTATANDFFEAGFDSSKGILLHDGVSIVYKVEVLKSGLVSGDMFFYIDDKLWAYCKVEINKNVFYLEPHSLYSAEGIQHAVMRTLAFILFKKHVQVEEKIISTKRSRYHSTSSGTVKTDFKYPVHVVDASFYTSYIKGDGFSVKGHKRHYKDGKVVDITPFKKSGYTRKAKKLSLAA